jgi:hypothetical protein
MFLIGGAITPASLPLEPCRIMSEKTTFSLNRALSPFGYMDIHIASGPGERGIKTITSKIYIKVV